MTRNCRKKFVLRNIAVFVLALMAGLFVRSSAHALERVRIALSVRNVVFLPFYYAKDTKIFDRHGLDAELIQMRSDLQLAGLISGEIDFTPAVGPATFGVANGMPIKAVAIPQMYCLKYVMADQRAASYGLTGSSELHGIWPSANGRRWAKNGIHSPR